MKKRLIALAVAGAFAAPLAAQAGDVEVSGFADVIYTLKNEARDGMGTDGKNDAEKKFTADGEIDVIASPADGVTARLDLDLDLVTDGGTNVNGSDSARIEQAMFAWSVTDQVAVMGGVFNSPIGYEEEDKPDIDFTSHNSIFSILDNQTALNGNNVAGVAVAGGTDMFNVGVAFLNDIQQVNEENSIAVFANVTPMQDVALEFGYVTQKNDNPVSTASDFGAGDVWDVNGQWKNIAGSGAMAGAEYLSTDEVFDGAWNIWGGFDFGQGLEVKARYENTASNLNGIDDAKRWTVYGSWQAASNLKIALEYSNGDVDTSTAASAFNSVAGISDGKVVTAQFLATLP